MTLTELRYIVAVAKTKHFGKAADECFVSQPTLSVGIRKLEDSLGITIFERGRSEVKITPIGQVIINQAQNVLAETEVIKNIVVANKNQLKDPIRIGSAYTIGKYLFPNLVRQIYNNAPELTVLLRQDYHNNLLNKLVEGDLDIILLSTNINTHCTSANVDLTKNHLIDPQVYADVCLEPVLQEDLCLLAGNRNKYAYSDTISPKEINIEDVFLLNKQHCLHEQILSLNPAWSDVLRGSNRENNLDSLEALHDLVVSTSGVTIVPAMFCVDFKLNQYSHEMNSNLASKIIEFTSPSPKRVLSLVWRRDFTRLQLVDTLKQCLKNINIPGVQAFEAG
jgi:LysR family hydrogen peroxide-inducible transcriptional activator